MMGFDGERVVVTGAGGGVGTALCTLFTEAGCEVVGCDLTKDSVPQICIERHGFDLRDGASADATAHAILKGRATSVLVSNAGWTRAETLSQVRPETFADEMDGNFTGVARFATAFLPAMRKATGNRSLVFVSSVNAVSHFGNPVYSAAKAAMMAWMRAIATEEGRSGIRANAVIPASIRTNAWTHRLAADPGILDRVSRLYPLGRLVTPREVANAVLFLASPLASGITGAALPVDAGLTGGNLPFVDAISSLER